MTDNATTSADPENKPGLRLFKKPATPIDTPETGVSRSNTDDVLRNPTSASESQTTVCSTPAGDADHRRLLRSPDAAWEWFPVP